MRHPFQWCRFIWCFVDGAIQKPKPCTFNPGYIDGYRNSSHECFFALFATSLAKFDLALISLFSYQVYFVSHSDCNTIQYHMIQYVHYHTYTYIDIIYIE